ncbi:nitroreductase [Amycolatopsis acidiphila]|uniref:Nitroreductase n=1 Tax=Amycolatopsis acidiphila TaxID=715473 RepID=A0A558ALG1_9PSEU|nr:nitroreductase [Amycolatopsis acidiphila]TVT25094.1 nitroreductase [Amycolatopsis acidiphila]UIJ57394.1 nitroreductase [Amycolatopsis acidiphila]GHG84451.1 nitroreductase [Amycolatopsis acidiphila]
MNDTTTEFAPAAATVEEALLTRRSVRAFLPTPVPRAEVERLLALASRSASNSNCQPWHVHVLTGESKRRLTEALWKALDADGRVAEREYPFQPAPEDWEEPFRTRRRIFGEGLYRDTLGIAAHDAEGRLGHHRRNYDFFGAPVGLILTVSRRPLAGALIDAGLFLQALMLAARHAGLDTCPQASFIDFYPVLRRQLNIPDDQLIVCGVALGYADREHCLSGYRTAREPVGEFTTFHSGELG